MQQFYSTFLFLLYIPILFHKNLIVNIKDVYKSLEMKLLNHLIIQASADINSKIFKFFHKKI